MPVTNGLCCFLDGRTQAVMAPSAPGVPATCQTRKEVSLPPPSWGGSSCTHRELMQLLSGCGVPGSHGATLSSVTCAPEEVTAPSSQGGPAPCPRGLWTNPAPCGPAPGLWVTPGGNPGSGVRGHGQVAPSQSLGPPPSAPWLPRLLRRAHRPAACTIVLAFGAPSRGAVDAPTHVLPPRTTAGVPLPTEGPWPEPW